MIKIRVKIIEKLIPINEISSIIRRAFKSQFTISKNSLITEDFLIIIGISEKGMISVVHSSINRNLERTYISVLVFRTDTLAKELNISMKSDDGINLIEKKMVQSLKNEGKESFLYPFIQLSKFQFENPQEKRKIFTVEWAH